jgi:hypothetical protein
MSIAEFSERYGPGRTTIYEEIKLGRLRARKCGKRTCGRLVAVSARDPSIFAFERAARRVITRHKLSIRLIYHARRTGIVRGAHKIISGFVFPK